VTSSSSATRLSIESLSAVSAATVFDIDAAW
jgi:hypothetical protein